jgi:hypothetical protein
VLDVGVTRLAKRATSARKIRILALYLAVGDVDMVIVDSTMVVADIVAVIAVGNRAMVIRTWIYMDAVGMGEADIDKIMEQKDMEVRDIYMALALLRL